MTKNNFRRVFLIVLDSVGIGHAKDAKKYGDEGANTILHIDKEVKGLYLPTLEKLGLGNFDDYIKIKKINPHKNYIGRLAEKSLGKDTMTGHWEMMGLNITKPFKTFTDTGFPEELINELSKKTGYGVIGNKSASGTEIIKELGEEHLKTKKIIVYTSADSVLQIAANERIIPVEELYRICEIAREITLKDEWKVGRVIARPFEGTTSDNFKRTPRRHDYALSPFSKTYLNYLKENNLDVIAVGKINDIFNGSGITRSIKTSSNNMGMDTVISLAKEEFMGLCFVNLVDFDMEYGHRRDPLGYGKSLEEFDFRLSELLPNISNDDLLILTADHGNDPTAKGSDHTRENVPFILYSPRFQSGAIIEIGDTFGNIGATIVDNFGIGTNNLLGISILNKLK
ncbi:MAG: phosphopentomutase [Bacilli bacterium]|nr:phosphopentomutase [Bacilli bacterium]